MFSWTVARVKDQATGVLVRRKGVNVTTVAMTEKEFWLDVMGRYTVKRNSSGSPKIVNFKIQDDVTIALECNHAQAGSLRSKAAVRLDCTPVLAAYTLTNRYLWSAV